MEDEHVGSAHHNGTYIGEPKEDSGHAEDTKDPPAPDYQEDVDSLAEGDYDFGGLGATYGQSLGQPLGQQRRSVTN